MSSSRSSLTRETGILLAIIVLGWGLSWPMIKQGLSEIPPLSFRGISATAGGVCTLLLARINGSSLVVPRGKGLRWRLAVLALFNILIWNILSTYGVALLSSGKAALLAYTMPLWCVPLSICFLSESLKLRQALALLLGASGVAVLIGPAALDFAHAPLGVLLMLSAALSWATGVVLMKRWSIAIDPMVMTGWLLLIGGLPLLPLALIFDGLPARVPSFWPLFALVFSALVTFMWCNWAWNRLVLLVPVSVSSLSSLLTPLVSVISGAILLGEQPGWPEALAALLILGAVAVINLPGRGS